MRIFIRTVESTVQGTMNMGNYLDAKAASKYITRQAILAVTEQKACSPNEDA